MSSAMPTVAPMPANELTAIQLIKGGLTITSTATAALNGKYAVVGAAYDALRAEADSLTRNSGTFLDGGTSVNWPDASGTGHTFDVAQFGTLINAIDRFVVGCFQYGAGVSQTAPSATATIP